MTDLSAMEIYQELPQTDCGECNFPTCMAFAMQLASKQVSLDECTQVTDEAKEELSASSAPPMRIITIGEGENELEVGGETVEYRHEEKFYRPPGVGVKVTDELDSKEVEERVEKINGLKFERIGEEISVDLVFVENSTLPPAEFGELVATVDGSTELPLVIDSENPEAVREGLENYSGNRPLIGRATEENWSEMADLALEYDAPLAVEGADTEELAELTTKLGDEGVEDMVLSPTWENISGCLRTLTELRRLAVDKEFSPLGFPVWVSTKADEPFQAVAEGTVQILKYASILSLDTVERWQVLPLLTVRQHVYIDPQVQNSVEARLYEVGDPDADSPVLFTTNFQLTYYSLEGEVEDSGFSAYISVMDTDGLGVLNAYADDQLSGEGIAETVREQGAMDKVNHDKLIIPGLVGMLRMGVQEEGGWEVIVGPEDSATLPRFLRQEWSNNGKK